MNFGRRRFLGQLCLTPLLGLAGCDAGITPATDKVEPTAGPDPLVLALFPFDTPSRIVKRFRPLAQRLGEDIGRPVRLHLAGSYENQVRLLVSGGADFAYMGPTTYIRAFDRYALPDGRRVHLLAGEAPYQGAIVVRSESRIHSLADLREHTFAFGAYSSLSGHFAPRALLREHGLTLADLKDYAFLDRHERVALSVLHGDYDAGALGLGAALRYADRAPGLRVIARTEMLPPLVFAARPDMDDAQLERLKDSLLGLNDPKIEPFSEVSNRDFDRARAIIASIENNAAGSGVASPQGDARRADIVHPWTMPSGFATRIPIRSRRIGESRDGFRPPVFMQGHCA